MGASESTLLRAFRRERGRSPSAYAREKKLDAALLLLRSGRYAISEVATRVGYGNLAAFSSAFARRFGSPPSSVRPHRLG
jgi:AraC-like DNA-binding protein